MTMLRQHTAISTMAGPGCPARHGPCPKHAWLAWRSFRGGYFGEEARMRVCKRCGDIQINWWRPDDEAKYVK